MIIDYPCKNRDDWESLKTKLKPSDMRVDWVTDLRSNQRERSRGRYITFNAIVGYDKLQKYVASERLLRAVLREPEWIKDMYWTDAKLVMAMCDKMIQGGFDFDGAFLYCDLGYRHGPFFSPRHYEAQLHPVFKTLCAFFHERDMQIILHTCGNVKSLIPYFIQEGIDCIQPLEVKAGMDLVELKQEFGKDIAFMGGIDVRNISLDDPNPLEMEIREKVSKAKVGGGFIYHSDHSIPNTVSFAQYTNVIELVNKYGGYDP
jgi:uroporphyrinogen decarboxylase